MSVEVIATYRVQLQSAFGFDAAGLIADYLAALGISHLYCSPYLQAAPGSKHGYDVVDSRKVNKELGGAEAHARFSDALSRHGLGQVLDIVPNHMAMTRENPWWQDVLENGPSSRYAAYFDVDWDPPEARVSNTVLLPVLGDHYGRVLEAGEIKLRRAGATFTVGYGDHEFPVAPRSLSSVLAVAAERCGSEELGYLTDAFSRLPLPKVSDCASVRKRHRDKEVLKVQLNRLCQERQEVADTIDRVIDEFNEDADALDGLLRLQNYRLAFWRTAEQELGYRRFFDINSLIGLRVEHERVFNDSHGLVTQWVSEGKVQGLRVDHPDGLRDPQEYFERLRAASPSAWVLAEKILEPEEKLPESWPVDGTTGYDFLNLAGGIFVDAAGEEHLTRFYEGFTGESSRFAETVREKKHQVMQESMGSDLNRLANLLLGICERHRRYRDYTRQDLRLALKEVIASFPVYRTYVRAREEAATDNDIGYVNEAIEAAKAYQPDLDRDLFYFLRDVLLLRIRGELEGELAMRFQQLTGAVMAKGVEDTVFYCFNRLISLNEVGGDPRRFGVPVEEFHRCMAQTRSRWPRTMLATSTHDTKRSEDVRMRLHLLSEIPERWTEAVSEWSAMNERHRRDGLPDRNAEYLLYQTLVGAWPIEVERVLAYMEKASREAKTRTSWSNPDPNYEAALKDFVEGIFFAEEFQASLSAFVAPLIEPGRVNSLGQTLIKVTAPGVPDFYQGSELWDLSLVDPDNRRPVDFDLRRRLLAQLDAFTPEEIWQRVDEGLPKLWVIRRGLDLRRRRSELFGPAGGYRPLLAHGNKSEHVVAFARGDEAVTVVPRLVLKLGGLWKETALELPRGRWRNELTGDEFPGGRLAVGDLLTRFPVALLTREEADS